MAVTMTVVSFMLSVFSAYPGAAVASAEIGDTVPPFDDLPDSSMYASSLELFRKANIIVGHTLGGVPQGILAPDEPLQRDGFTKVAVIVRLLEEGNTHLLGSGLSEFTLKLNTLLLPYYSVTAENGAVRFSDVADKDTSCAKDAGMCTPWFAEFVNYASSQGMVKGYTSADGSQYFSPEQTIPRLYAFKLVLAQDGNVPAQEDTKFRRLSSDSRIKNRPQKCLSAEGLEDLLLENNGGANNPDAQNLLAYALLADRLDFFGNACQALTENGVSLSDPEAILSWLLSPVTRKEIARFFALSNTVSELQIDPSIDPTVDTAAEYITPYRVIMKQLTAEAEDASGISETDEKTASDRILDNSTGTSFSAQKAEKAVTYINKSVAEMTLDELIAFHPEGRCCSHMTLNSSCPVISFSGYAIEDETVYNWEDYGGPSWYVARKGSSVCYIPNTDVTAGYEKGGNAVSNRFTDSAGYDQLAPSADTFMDFYISEEAGSAETEESDEPWYQWFADTADAIDSKITAAENAVIDFFQPVTDTIVVKEAELNEFLKNSPYVSDGVLAGYWYSKGVFKSGQDSLSGLYGMIRHPLETGEAVVIAAVHPVKTLDAVSNEAGNTIIALIIECPPRDEECFVTQGEALGDTAQLLIGGAAMKTASKTGALDEMAEIANVTRKSLDDVLSLTKYADELAAATKGKKAVHFVRLSGTTEEQLAQLIKLCEDAKGYFGTGHQALQLAASEQIRRDW